MNIHGVLETIGGITFAKWRPNLENAAPVHTTTINSFAATIMSTNGYKAKKISAGGLAATTASSRPRHSR
jgi:hypothetical protein